MLFNSLSFVVFFALVLALYYALPGWLSRKRVLLVASYLFYAAWSPPFVLLLLLSTSMDWGIARRMQAASTDARRKTWLLLSLAANLGLLGYFKYGQFLLDNFVAAAALAGLQYAPPESSIVLPVGISFYTFQSLSYTIDVYRRRLKADASFADFALFVSFFPQLVAGPIVRATDLLPQLLTRRQATPDQLGWGLSLLVFGLFQKIVLADAIFAPVADAVFNNAAAFAAADVWVAVFAFSGQIFCDFSGYTLCAIGAALCLGFVLPENFRQPYAALGFSDFWRRWHISLSSWLRDYLYIPLGGNRAGTAMALRNLMLTMLIGGLWHGASWLFVLWGGLHGLCLVIERLLDDRNPVQQAVATSRLIRQLGTFLLVSLIWIPFRATDWTVLEQMLAGLVRPVGSDGLSLEARLMACFALAGLLRWQLHQRDLDLRTCFGDWGRPVQSALIAICLLSIFLASGGDERAFIYFQF